MKKTLILALLAALVLGIFTACNGDVNAALLGKRTITLEIPSSIAYFGWKFDNNDTTLVVEVPSGCDTWEQFLENVTDIEINDGSDSCTLRIYDNSVYFCYYYVPTSVTSYWVPRFGLDTPKSSASTNIIAGDKIVLGKTYTLIGVSS